MNKKALKGIILVTGLITALIHLIWLNISFVQNTGSPDLLFTLNGLGYLGLLAIFFTKPDFLADQWEFVHYIFMAFAFVTIIAFFIFGSMTDLLGWFTKVDEVILIVALWLHSQKISEPASA